MRTLTSITQWTVAPWMLLSWMAACGPAPRAPAPPPRAPIDAPDSELRPAQMSVTPSGLQMEFGPGVARSQALRFAWGCWFEESDNPRTGGLRCPVSIGQLHIDVDEGPAGVTLMLRLGDARVADQLRNWYETAR